MAKNYITPDGFKNLQEEFKELYYVERPKVVEVVSWAAGNGDRSENGDYIYGKKRLREIDRRLKFLRDRIEASLVVDPQSVDVSKIVFGCVIEIEDEDGENRSLQIVGADEVDISNNKISWKSPLAKSLLGKKVGDEAIVKTPKKTTFYEVLNIKRPSR